MSDSESFSALRPQPLPLVTSRHIHPDEVALVVHLKKYNMPIIDLIREVNEVEEALQYSSRLMIGNMLRQAYSVELK